MKTILLCALFLTLPLVAAQAQSVDIKCNGEDQDVIVFENDDVTLTIDILANGGRCYDVDYWVFLKHESGLKWSFSSYDRQWHTGRRHVYFTGPLMDIQDTVLDEPMPLGKYKARCLIDGCPNGRFDRCYLIARDRVKFEVVPDQPPPPPIYQYDDGTSENASGLAGSGEFCWIHRFDALPGAETIDEIQVAFGTPLAPGGAVNGEPCTVYVWNDPDDDGDPANAVLLTSQAGTIQNADTDILNAYALGSPATVSGVFFIGCMTDSAPGSGTPAPMDLTTPYIVGNGWFAFALPPNTFDANDLSNNNLFENVAGTGFGYYYLLRAAYQE